jgi:hypothetical protein
MARIESADLPPALHRPLGGRHTLGSSPESHEPVEDTPAPSLPDLVPAGAGEPRATLYMPWWEETWARALAVEPAETRQLFTRLLSRMQEGWEYVRPLGRWYEEHAESAAGGSDEYQKVMEFIKTDLLDIFREIATDVTRLVPGYDGWPDAASPDDVDGEVDAFNRWLVVFGLAAESPGIPEGLRALARASTRGLAGWSAEMAVLAKTIQDEVLSPLRDDDTEPSIG